MSHLRDETFRAALKKTLLTRMVRTNSAVSKPPPTAPIVSEFYRIITTLNSICTSASILIHFTGLFRDHKEDSDGAMARQARGAHADPSKETSREHHLEESDLWHRAGRSRVDLSDRKPGRRAIGMAAITGAGTVRVRQWPPASWDWPWAQRSPIRAPIMAIPSRWVTPLWRPCRLL
jgi:hypothetical protein